MDDLWQGFEFQGVVMVPLVAGIACMGGLYRWLPRPMWVYVLGHEFTHALATMACGGRVKGMKVTGEGGHVYVTGIIFCHISPVFCAAVCRVGVRVIRLGTDVLGVEHPVGLGSFHWALGLAYAFHVLLTVEILRTRQPDITSQGPLFSGVIILLGNTLILMAGWSLVMGEPGLMEVGREVVSGVGRTFQDMGGWAQRGVAAINSALK